MGALLVPSAASANVSPPGCTGNKANFDIDRTAGVAFRLGDALTFIITGDNIKNSGCDIALTGPLNFSLPNNRGVPAGASTTILSSGSTFKFGDTLATVNVPWTVAADPDVKIAQVELAGNADLKDVADPAHDFFKIDRTISIQITHPSMAITKVANPVQGLAPLTVTYTYVLTNTGDANIGNINVSDAGLGACSPLVYSSGDTNADSILGAASNVAGVVTPAEAWTYTCQRVFPVAGVFPNVVTATGTSTVDKRPVNPVQANASVTVTTTAPPAPPAPAVPQSAVKPASAVQAPCTLSTVKSLSVRAGELTTIKVTAKNVPAKTLVTITLPGGKKVTARTNSSHVALLHVRPTKTGTASIKAADCSDVEKLTVKAARKVVSQRVPQVTG